MLLTDTKIKNAKPDPDKIQKLRDGKSLFLHIEKNGTKRFVMSYRFDGKQRSYSIGEYPTMTLLEARAERKKAQALLAKNIDPNDAKKFNTAGSDSVKEVAIYWFEKYKKTVIQKTADRAWGFLEKYIFPQLGRKSIVHIKRRDLVLLIEPILEKEKFETADKLCRIITRIFDDAMNRGITEATVASGLSKIVPVHEVTHRAALLDTKKFGEFLADLEQQVTIRSASVLYCLRILPYVFLRNTALRTTPWSEIDLDKGEWIVGAERMKQTRDKVKSSHPHFVPLAKQVVALLRELHSVTGDGKYLFPSPHNKSRPLSDGALRVALRTMGYAKEEVSVHGFRSTASTFLHELGFEDHIIDRQMSHKDDNRTKAAYNFAEYREKRIAMMQSWADYVDSLRRDHI